MEPFSDFQEFFRSLNSHGVEYVIVGGYAMGYWGWPRYTKDMDLLVAANEENARRIVAALRDFGFESSDLAPDDFGLDESRFRSTC